MGRAPYVPEALRNGPFTLAQAGVVGVQRWHLEGSSWMRMAPGTYVWAGLRETSISKIDAVRQRLPDEAVFSGPTAAWLHGIEVLGSTPLEVSVERNVALYHRSGVRVRRVSLPKTDVVTVKGFRVTSPLRTVVDLCGALPLVEAVVLADSALNMRRVRIEELARWARTRPGRAGVARLRRVVGFADARAESPMETRLRMLMVLRGLPRPQVQVPVYDQRGRFAGRPDLLYEDKRLGIEYDGGIHRDSLARDDHRQNRLLDAGVRLLRFTAADVLGHPTSVVAQVRGMLERL